MTLKGFYRLVGSVVCLTSVITAFCGLYDEATYMMLAALYFELSGAE